MSCKFKIDNCIAFFNILIKTINKVSNFLFNLIFFIIKKIIEKNESLFKI